MIHEKISKVNFPKLSQLKIIVLNLNTNISISTTPLTNYKLEIEEQIMRRGRS